MNVSPKGAAFWLGRIDYALLADLSYVACPTASRNLKWRETSRGAKFSCASFAYRKNCRRFTKMVPHSDPGRSLMDDGVPKEPLQRNDFEAELRMAAVQGYYDQHPFHKLLHGGELDKGQVQAWALNRYSFQAYAPRKDAVLIARSASRDFRREWTLRLLDHDGFGQDEGGLERWLKLTDALGLDRRDVQSMTGVLPKTIETLESYLAYVREEPFVAAVATTLTELLAPKLHRHRLSSMLESYDFIDREALTYFSQRLTHAPRDASFALEYVCENTQTRNEQEKCIEAVRFKCRMLWSLLDALQDAYVLGNCPPGAFRSS